MIKFFRKIRQNLLSEGNTGTYFKYAIGEIVLVVIGILIALQINNWNEENKNAIVLSSHLVTILENLENDKAQLLELIEKRSVSIKESTLIIDSYKNNETIDSELFIGAFLNIVIELKFDSDQNGFELLKASKSFELDKMKNLRAHIVNYNEVLEDVKFLETRQNAHSETMESELWRNGFYDQTWAYFRHKTNSTKFEEPNDNIEPNLLITNYGEIKGLFLRNEFVMQSAIIKYNLLIEKGEVLSKEINNYLNE